MKLLKLDKLENFDPSRGYKKLVLPLESYQNIIVVPILGDQYIGDYPLMVQVTSAIDEKFINNSLSLQLSDNAQRDLINLLQLNLSNSTVSIKNYLEAIKYSEFII